MTTRRGVGWWIVALSGALAFATALGFVLGASADDDEPARTTASGATRAPAGPAMRSEGPARAVAHEGERERRSAETSLAILARTRDGSPVPSAQVFLTARASHGSRVELLGSTDDAGSLHCRSEFERLGASDSKDFGTVPSFTVHAESLGLRSTAHELRPDTEGPQSLVLWFDAGSWLVLDYPRVLAQSSARIFIESANSSSREASWLPTTGHRGAGDRALQTIGLAAPGARLAIAIRDSGNVDLGTSTATVPTQPLATTVIRLEIGARVFAARVRGENDGPLRGLRVELHGLASGPRTLFATDAELEADGSLLVGIATQRLAGGLQSVLIALVDEPSGALLAAHAAPEPGFSDLGEVHLRALPELAQGVCVDERGEPVAEAQVSASAGDDSGGRRRLHVTCDGSGAFSVLGLLLGERLLVGASSPRHLASPLLEVGPRTTGLRIELRRGASLMARADRGHLALIAELVDVNSPASPIPANGFVERDQVAEWHWSMLRPGLHDLRIRLLGDRNPLIEILAIEARFPAETRDPRLDGIRLEFETCALALVGLRPQAETMGRTWGRGAYVFWREHDAWHGFGFDPAEAVELPLPRGNPEVLLVVPGHAPTLVALRPGALRVPLREERRIVIRSRSPREAKRFHLERAPGTAARLDRFVVYESSRVTERWDDWPSLHRPWHEDGNACFAVPAEGGYLLCVDEPPRTTKFTVLVPPGRPLITVSVDSDQRR
jgi:hypothetical protein